MSTDIQQFKIANNYTQLLHVTYGQCDIRRYIIRLLHHQLPALDITTITPIMYNTYLSAAPLNACTVRHSTQPMSVSLFTDMYWTHDPGQPCNTSSLLETTHTRTHNGSRSLGCPDSVYQIFMAREHCFSCCQLPNLHTSNNPQAVHACRTFSCQ